MQSPNSITDITHIGTQTHFYNIEGVIVSSYIERPIDSRTRQGPYGRATVRADYEEVPFIREMEKIQQPLDDIIKAKGIKFVSTLANVLDDNTKAILGIKHLENAVSSIRENVPRYSTIDIEQYLTDKDARLYSALYINKSAMQMRDKKSRETRQQWAMEVALAHEVAQNSAEWQNFLVYIKRLNVLSGLDSDDALVKAATKQFYGSLDFDKHTLDALLDDLEKNFIPGKSSSGTT